MIGTERVKIATARDQSWEQAGLPAAVLTGAVWATIPLLLAPSPAAESRYLVVALLFAAMSVEALALARSRSCANVFCAMLAGASAVTAAGSATASGYALSLFSLAYGAAIIGVSRIARQTVADTARARQDIAKRDGMITLSLREDAGPNTGWMFETDAEGGLTSTSAGLSVITGIAWEELAGKPFSGLFPFDCTGAGWNRLLLAMAARQGVECAVELLVDGRHLWWQVCCRPVLKPDGEFAGHAGAAHSITGERMARQRLGEERQQALAECSKAAQLMEDVTQEIRSPLNTVLGFAEILNSSAVRDLTEAERRTYNQLLLDSSRSLSAFMADVSDMVRLNRDHLRLMEHEVDAAELAEIAMKSCHQAAEAADVTILVNVFDGVELRCDANRIGRALATLVTRAVQASGPGSTVRVSFAKLGDGALVISIADNGASLPASELDRIFEPAIAERGMSGLALPIARRNVMLHGGCLEIESVQGAGTTARLILPAACVTWIASVPRAAAHAA